jgi:hypothetical protein
VHPRRDHDRARLGQRLRPGRDVWHVAEYFARCIQHHRPGIDCNASCQHRLARASVLPVQLGQRPLDRQRRPHCPLGIVLLRHRIAEQCHQPVAELLGDFAAHFHDRRGGHIEISANQKGRARQSAAASR